MLEQRAVDVVTQFVGQHQQRQNGIAESAAGQSLPDSVIKQLSEAPVPCASGLSSIVDSRLDVLSLEGPRLERMFRNRRWRCGLRLWR